MLTARTLAEAQVYLSLMAADDAGTPIAAAAADGPADGDDAIGAPDTRLAEGEDGWTVSWGEGPTAVEVAVPYAAEDAARRVGARFGLGVSQLVDAGQWVLVATTYAQRALDADLAYAGESADARRRVELNWQFAADALGEAVKFLPDGVDEIPPEGFWSALGSRAREEDPESFTRARLSEDLAYYRDTLEDFRSLHGPSS